MMPGRIILRTGASISVSCRYMEQIMDMGNPRSHQGEGGGVKSLQGGAMIVSSRGQLVLGNLAVLCLG